MNDKTNKILQLYKLIRPEYRSDFKFMLAKKLGISANYLYEKILKNNFRPDERALLAYHLGIPQQTLFPDQEETVCVSSSYTTKNYPFFKEFSAEDSKIYNPKELEKLLTTQNQSTKVL